MNIPATIAPAVAAALRRVREARGTEERQAAWSAGRVEIRRAFRREGGRAVRRHLCRIEAACLAELAAAARTP